MIVINFFAGPGSGKSTGAAALFAKLKNKGLRVELAREFAKDLIYEGRKEQLRRNQLFVTAGQYARLKDLEASGCDIAITDSPLALGLAYARDMQYFTELVTLIGKLESEFTNLNVWVDRVKPYQTFGRLQDETAARALDTLTFDLGYPFQFKTTGDESGQTLLAETVLQHADVAQLVEQKFCKLPVEGSTPSVGSIPDATGFSEINSLAWDLASSGQNDLLD